MTPSSPSSSSWFIDPFSAIYKAHPGQLPSFFSNDNYKSVEKSVDGGKSHAQNQKNNTSLQASGTVDPKENPNQSALNPSSVFSPLLAGERNRLIRKRILSNPEHSMPGSIPSSTSATESSLLLSPSKMANLRIQSTDSVTFDVIDDDEDDDDYSDEGADDLSFNNLESSDQDDYDENTLSNIQLRFTTNAISHNPIERFPVPARSSIFFSPPKRLPSVDEDHQNNDKRDPQSLQLTKDIKSAVKSGDHETFSSAFYHVIFSGNTCIDLENQNIHLVPDLLDLLKKQKSRLGNYADKDAEKMTALIERMTNTFSSSGSTNRKTIARARSAPLVSFSPHNVFTLILSNNFLNSTFSNIQRISQLKGLEVLSLRANLLTEIPNEFGDLKNLKSLNLSHNLLNFLPSSILKLKNCQFLLNGNPWFKPSSSDRSGRKFQWISKPKQVFCLASLDNAPFDSPQRSIPSLMESCIRKLCITKDPITGEEQIIDHQNSAVDQNESKNKICSSQLNHSSFSDSYRSSLFPKPIKKILANPRQNFCKCELCEKRLILNSKDKLLNDRYHDDIFDQDQHDLSEFFQFKKLNQQNDHPINPDINSSLTHEIEGEECDNPSLNNFFPIRWIACSFDCCVEELIND